MCDDRFSRTKLTIETIETIETTRLARMETRHDFLAHGVLLFSELIRTSRMRQRFVSTVDFYS